MCVGAKISANERILEKIHEKAHNFGTKVRIFHSSHMFSAEKVSSLTRLFHLRGVPSGRDTYRGAAISDEAEGTRRASLIRKRGCNRPFPMWLQPRLKEYEIYFSVFT